MTDELISDEEFIKRVRRQVPVTSDNESGYHLWLDHVLDRRCASRLYSTLSDEQKEAAKILVLDWNGTLTQLIETVQRLV